MNFMRLFGIMTLAAFPLAFMVSLLIELIVTACLSCSVKKEEDEWNQKQLKTYKIEKAKASQESILIAD